MKILVTLTPFGNSPEALAKLNNFFVLYNDRGQKYTKPELLKIIDEYVPDIIIAGTEKYDRDILSAARNLKIICRAGVGIDSIDLNECNRRQIIVTNTPTCARTAVAELVIGQMLNALRNIQYLHGTWNREVGRELNECQIGIIGIGNIGGCVVEKLRELTSKTIFVNDLDKTKVKVFPYAKFVPKEYLLKNSDIISLHIPLVEPTLSPTYNNHNFITQRELDLLKSDAIIINTSRGGIINEDDLHNWLKQNKQAKAVIDTFNEEPYNGGLKNLPNAFLTPHLGSCTESCRRQMELAAVEEALNFINQQPLNHRIV